MFNNDANYARSRLNASYMKGKDSLFYISDIVSRDNLLDKAVIIGYDHLKRERKLNIKDLNFCVGKLGYVNDVMTGLAMFISRIPIRRDFRQGLRSAQLCYNRNGSSGSISEVWLDQNIKAVNDCLNSKYPDFTEVIDLVEEYNNDVAFSKNFALSSKYRLLYKGFVIGDLTKDDRFKLHNQFNFVEEEFAKEVGNDKLSR